MDGKEKTKTLKSQTKTTPKSSSKGYPSTSRVNDYWTTKDSLALASAVQTVGDRNWLSVSRSMKPIGDQCPDWYTPKKCALQYSKLLKLVEDKSKPMSRTERENMEDQLVKTLHDQRMLELSTLMEECSGLEEEFKDMLIMVDDGCFDKDGLDFFSSEIEKFCDVWDDSNSSEVYDLSPPPNPVPAKKTMKHLSPISKSRLLSGEESTLSSPGIQDSSDCYIIEPDMEVSNAPDEVSPQLTPPQPFFNPTSMLATAAARQLAIATSPVSESHTSISEIVNLISPTKSTGSQVTAATLSAPTLSKLLEMPPSIPGKLPPLPTALYNPSNLIEKPVEEMIEDKQDSVFSNDNEKSGETQMSEVPSTEKPATSNELGKVTPNKNELNKNMPNEIKLDKNMPNENELDNNVPCENELIETIPNEDELVKNMPNENELIKNISTLNELDKNTIVNKLDKNMSNKSELRKNMPNENELQKVLLDENELQKEIPGENELQKEIQDENELDKDISNENNLEKETSNENELDEKNPNENELDEKNPNENEMDKETPGHGGVADFNKNDLPITKFNLQHNIISLSDDVDTLMEDQDADNGVSATDTEVLSLESNSTHFSNDNNDQSCSDTIISSGNSNVSMKQKNEKSPPESPDISKQLLLSSESTIEISSEKFCDTSDSLPQSEDNLHKSISMVISPVENIIEDAVVSEIASTESNFKFQSSDKNINIDFQNKIPSATSPFAVLEKSDVKSSSTNKSSEKQSFGESKEQTVQRKVTLEIETSKESTDIKVVSSNLNKEIVQSKNSNLKTSAEKEVKISGTGIKKVPTAVKIHPHYQDEKPLEALDERDIRRRDEKESSKRKRFFNTDVGKARRFTDFIEGSNAITRHVKFRRSADSADDLQSYTSSATTTDSEESDSDLELDKDTSNSDTETKKNSLRKPLNKSKSLNSDKPSSSNVSNKVPPVHHKVPVNKSKSSSEESVSSAIMHDSNSSSTNVYSISSRGSSPLTTKKVSVRLEDTLGGIFSLNSSMKSKRGRQSSAQVAPGPRRGTTTSVPQHDRSDSSDDSDSESPDDSRAPSPDLESTSTITRRSSKESIEDDNQASDENTSGSHSSDKRRSRSPAEKTIASKSISPDKGLKKPVLSRRGRRGGRTIPKCPNTDPPEDIPNTRISRSTSLNISKLGKQGSSVLEQFLGECEVSVTINKLEPKDIAKFTCRAGRRGGGRRGRGRSKSAALSPKSDAGTEETMSENEKPRCGRVLRDKTKKNEIKNEGCDVKSETDDDSKQESDSESEECSSKNKCDSGAGGSHCLKSDSKNKDHKIESTSSASSTDTCSNKDGKSNVTGKQKWSLENTASGSRSLATPTTSDSSDDSSEDSDDSNETTSSNKTRPKIKRLRKDRDAQHIYKRWKKSICMIWREASYHKFANVFSQKVTDELAPGYESIVNRPMDLQQIKKNIDNGVITTTAQFQRDLMLMFQNAIMYNSSDHDVYHMALEMQKDVNKLVQDYIATQMDVEEKVKPPPVQPALRAAGRNMKIANLKYPRYPLIDGISANVKHLFPDSSLAEKTNYSLLH